MTIWTPWQIPMTCFFFLSAFSHNKMITRVFSSRKRHARMLAQEAERRIEREELGGSDQGFAFLRARPFIYEWFQPILLDQLVNLLPHVRGFHFRPQRDVQNQQRVYWVSHSAIDPLSLSLSPILSLPTLPIFILSNTSALSSFLALSDISCIVA